MILYLLLFLTFALMVGASLLLPFVTSIQYQKRNRFQLKQAQHFPIWMVVLVEFRRRVVFLLDFIVHYIHENYTMKPLELNPKVGEYGKLDVEIIKPSSKDEQTFGMLSPTDAPFPPSHYCFQFEGFLDRKLLVESLSDVLKYIPRLGSKLIQFKSLDELKRETSGWFDELSTMERRIVEGRLLKANKPITLFDLRNVQLEVCFAEDDTIKTHEETGLLTATDLAKNMHILSVFGVRGPLKVIHSEPTDPLTRLQVTYLRKSNKTALTVYMDHAVGDASSMSMFMQLLGDILSSKQTGKEFKPHNLPVANPVPIYKFGYNKEAEKLDDFLFTYYDPTACYSFFRAEVFKYLDQNSKNPAKIIAKEITVNKKQLEQLKKKIITETPELTDVAFSTNDMLNVLLLRAVAFGDKINRVASEKLFTLRYVASFRERCDYITSNYFGNAFGIIFNSVSKKDLLEKTTGELILMAKKNSEKTVHNQGYWETKLEEMNQRYFDPLQVDFGFPAFEGNENFMGVTNWVKPMLDIGSHFQDKSYLGISTLCMPFPHVNKILPTSTTDPNGGVRLVLSLYEPEYLYFVGEIPKI